MSPENYFHDYAFLNSLSNFTVLSIQGAQSQLSEVCSQHLTKMGLCEASLFRLGGQMLPGISPPVDLRVVSLIVAIIFSFEKFY